MDVVILSRLQFAITTCYHFLFVPLSIGLCFFVAIRETIAYSNGNSEDENIARFWNRLFLLCFIIGVVTGIVQEFQFGMNWGEYSRFVGDVFGVPLAIEAVLAFFVQSTFIGLWTFGRNVLPRGVHLACIWILCFTTFISAYWILVANGFMQNPVGYVFKNGRLEMTDFIAIITNPYSVRQFFHTAAASICTAAFFVLGISAWKIYKKADDSYQFNKSFMFALFMALFGIVMIFISGLENMKSVAKHQPMKFAAMGNIEQTTNKAPFSIVPGVEIPSLLSFAAHNKLEGKVKGLNDLQKETERRYGKGEYIPPKWFIYIVFRIMLICTFIMLFIVLYGIIWHLLLKKQMHKKALLFMVFAILIPFISNTAGWLVAEVGRQPWVVYGLMPIKKAISLELTKNEIIFSMSAFTAVYTLILCVGVFLIKKEIIRGHVNNKGITRQTRVVEI